MLILDEVDQKILTAIKKQSLSTSKIARKTGLVRTAVLYRLVRLKKNGKVQSEKGKMNAVLWQQAFAHKARKSDIHIYEGDDFLSGYTAIWNLKRGSIVYSVEGSEALALGIGGTWTNTFMFESQRAIRQKQLIVKCITNQVYIDLISTLHTDVLEAHRKRASGNKIYPSRSEFNECSQIIVSNAFVLITNVKKQKLILLKDPAVVSLVFSVFRLLFEYVDVPLDVSRKLQFQTVIDGILVERTQNQITEL